MKGLKLRTIVGLFCLVLCAAGVLVAHVSKQNAFVRQSMAVVKLGKQRAQLRNDIALLEVSVGGLKKLSRIESLAKGRFGLEYGNTPELVYMDQHAGEGSREGIERTAASGNAGERKESESKGLMAGKVAWLIKGL